MTARVVLISAPDEATMERVTALLRLVAGLAEGYAASRGGGGACDPDAINRRADALVAAWVYDVRYARPMPEDVARMIAEAVGLAGVVCRVEVVREMDAELTADLDAPEEPAPMLPLDLDGAALRSLRALCGTDYAARIAWSRWGVTVAVVGIAGTVAQSTDATIADAVAGCALILGREVPEIDATRAALGSAPTMAPPTE